MGNLLILLGVVLILAVILINVIDIIKSELAVRNFNEKKIIVEALRPEDDGEEAVANQEAAPYKDPVLAELVGILKINKIDLEEAIREGSTSSVLSSALGHMENTAMPGEDGNCCIAGHRNYTFGKYFNRLNELEIGDTIQIETMDEEYTYRVYDIFVVEPEQVNVLNTLEGKNLTLITCTPLFVGSHRLIIRAALEEN